MAGCHTLLHLCKSVRICGSHFSARRFCVFRGFCGNIVSHRFHGFAQMAWLRRFSHGFHRSTQMVCCINSPTEFTEFTEVWGCCWLRGYGRMPYPPNLCQSVPICGRCFSARRFCAFRGFCGNIVSHGIHGSTQMVGCVCSPTEFTEFTEVLLRWFSHRIHGIHRSFIASHSSINLESVLWEVLLCQKVLCVPCVLWEYSLPRNSRICTDGWLRLFSHGIHRIHRSLGVLLAAWVRQDAIPS